MKKRITSKGLYTVALVLCLLVVLGLLSGCRGYELYINYDDANGFYEWEYDLGRIADLNAGKTADMMINGQPYVKASHQYGAPGLGYALMGQNDMEQFMRCVYVEGGGGTIVIGDMTRQMPYKQDGSGPEFHGEHSTVWPGDILDLIINIHIKDGLTPEDLWNQNIGGIQKYNASKQAYQNYQNADAAGKEKILDHWMPQYNMHIHFAAPVAVLKGEQWCVVDGNDVTINIGQMMRDGGGDVSVFSCRMNIGNQVNPEYHADLLPKEYMGFTDLVEGAWYIPAVQYALDNKIMSGYGDGTFGPDHSITFAQLSQMMFNASGDKDYAGSLGTTHWGDKVTAWAVEKDLLFMEDLYDNGKVTYSSIDRNMTREQAICALTKYALMIGQTYDDSVEPEIPDFPRVEDRHKDMIRVAYQMGITHGINDKGTFDPRKAFVRCQVAQVFYNMNW